MRQVHSITPDFTITEDKNFYKHVLNFCKPKVAVRKVASQEAEGERRISTNDFKVRVMAIKMPSPGGINEITIKEGESCSFEATT